MTAVDQFWNVRAREEAEEAELRRQIDGIQRVIALGRRALALRAAEGFTDFTKAVHDLHEHAVRSLTTAALDDGTLREVRGKVQALRDVLALLEGSPAALEMLASREETLQNQLKAVLHARPKPRSER